MKWKDKTEEIIVGIEAEQISHIMGGEIEVMTLRITTNNHGYSFVLPYNEGVKLKIGDKISVEKKLVWPPASYYHIIKVMRPFANAHKLRGI